MVDFFGVKILEKYWEVYLSIDNNIVAVLKRSFHYVTMSFINTTRNFWVILHPMEYAVWQFPEATVVMTVPEYTAQNPWGAWQTYRFSSHSPLWRRLGSHSPALPRILGIPGQSTWHEASKGLHGEGWALGCDCPGTNLYVPGYPCDIQLPVSGVRDAWA